MKPVVLAILDGWGYTSKRGGNPIQEAHKSNLDAIEKTYPMTLLQASGLGVGLAWGNYGNSEVGHLTIGAGRIVQQYATRIDRAIKDGSFAQNPVIVKVLSFPRVHIIGLLTAGTVHAQISHVLALLDAKPKNTEVFLHFFTDGKDSGLQESAMLLKKIPHPIATIIGRNFGMDRDNNWELTEIAYNLIAKAQGEIADNFEQALALQYEQGLSDTKIPPLRSPAYTGIKEDDAVFFFNFREDSMRQLYQLFLKNQRNIYSMTEYLAESKETAAFPPPKITNNLAEVISKEKKKQFHIAETLKYAHVTFFFDGLRNEPYENEEQVLIPSTKDIVQKPAMMAPELGARLIEEIEKEKTDLFVINFANADMLAHTGNYEATKQGVEIVDEQIGRIMEAVLRKDGILIITADHGNAEELIDPITSEAESRHGDSPVPFFLIAKQYQNMGSKNVEVSGVLADIAPTILELMEIEKPIEMTGVSLLPALLDRGT